MEKGGVPRIKCLKNGLRNFWIIPKVPQFWHWRNRCNCMTRCWAPLLSSPSPSATRWASPCLPRPPPRPPPPAAPGRGGPEPRPSHRLENSSLHLLQRQQRRYSPSLLLIWLRVLLEVYSKQSNLMSWKQMRKLVPRDNRYLRDSTTEDRIFLDTCVVNCPDPTG